MDKQNQLGLDSVNNAGSGLSEVPWNSPAGGQLQEAPWFEQQQQPATATQPAQPAQPAQQGARRDSVPNPYQQRGAISSDRLDAIAQREGLTPEQARIWKQGILAQESGQGANSRTSVDGARGPGQVIGDTFNRYAKPGERVDNEDNNLAVSARIVKDLAGKFGNDPAKIAVGYFSGEGNVNPGTGNPYKNDRADGNGKRTSAYAADIVRRLGGVSEAQAAQPAPPGQIPKWKDIVAKPEFSKLSPEDQQAAKELYFDHYIKPVAGSDAASLREEFLAKPNPVGAPAAPTAPAQPGQPAQPAAAAPNLAAPPQPGASTAPSAEVNGFANAAGAMLDAEAGNPPVPARTGGSVMANGGRTTPPSASFAPVQPEVRRAIESKWDASTPQQRRQMEAAPGWQGDIARARAAGFARQDKTFANKGDAAALRGQLEAAYDAAPPEEKRRLEALPGWQGEIFRQKRDGVFALTTEPAPAVMPNGSPTVRSVDPRIEARRAELIARGEDPRFADAAAKAGAERGALPGQERLALEGVAENSDFDFETAKLFDSNARPNGLNNPLVRGVVKSASDMYKFSAGINEFVFDMAGADDIASGIRRQSDWLRAKDQAMGDGGALKNVEGAIRSIATQLPFIASGTEAVALGGMAMTVFGQEYSDGRARGQSIGEATARAGLYAVAELIGEKLSIGANMKAYKALFDKTAVDQLPKLLGQILAREVPGETLTTTLQFGTDKLPNGVGLNTEAGLTEFIQQQTDTLVQTLIQSTLMGGAPMARAHLAGGGGPNERRLAELRAMAAQDQAMAKWEQFRQSLRPQGRVEPSMQGEAPMPSNVGPDGRIEPTMDGTPASPANITPDGRVEPAAPVLPQAQGNQPNQIVTDADKIVAQLAENAGIPQSTVLPPAQPQPDPLADADLSDFAEVRLEQLRSAMFGGTKMVMTESGPQETEVPPRRLTSAETNELKVLESGNMEAINAFYGLRSTSPETPQPNGVPNESVQAQPQIDGTASGSAPQNAAGADGQPSGTTTVAQPDAAGAGSQVGAEGGQRQQRLSAEGPVNETEAQRDDRLEREAIQSEADFKPNSDGDDSDIPFDAKPSNVTQTTQTQQAEAQGSEQAATADAAVTTPRTEREAQLQRQYKESADRWNELSSEYRTATPQRQAELREEMNALNVEQRRIQGEVQRIGQQRQQEKQRAESKQKFGAMPVGTKIGAIGFENNDSVYWEKTGADEWTRNGIGSEKPTKTNAEMEGDRVVADKRANSDDADYPQMTVEQFQQRPEAYIVPRGILTTDLDAMFDEVLAEEAGGSNSEPAASQSERKKWKQPFGSQLGEPKTFDFGSGQITVKATVAFDPEKYAEIYGEPGGIVNFELNGEGVESSTGFKSVSGVIYKGEMDEATLSDAMLKVAQDNAKKTKPKTEKEAKQQRTAKEAATSAAKNTAEGFKNAIDGLGELFGGGPGTLGSGPVFNEETYKKAKPLFQAAIANFEQAGADIKEVMRAVIKAVLEKFGKQATENMKPYIVRFVQDYQEEQKGEATEPVAAPTDLYTPEGKMKVAKELADFLIGGGAFNSIFDARSKIGDLIGKKIEAGTELAKQADETVEVAVVLAAREMIEAGRKQGRSKQVIYTRLVDLYDRQPNLAVRSSTSVRDQAYSTPVPLAYLAAELAGVTYDTKVLEPTAGNGMLLIGAKPGNSVANELNGKRAAMLDEMGFKSKTDNAATETLAPPKSQDAVIANPPFGATKAANGETIVYEVKPDYGTREVDHAIAFNALEAMKDDGRAVLIVGGSNATSEAGRREDYRGKSKRAFYFNLYKEYNVVDHFTVAGSMYSKQGASYPVDVIVIEGRGKSARDLPAADLPQIIRSYDELKEKLNGTRSVGTEGVQRPDRTAGGETSPGQGDGAGVVGGTGRPGERTGGEGGAGGNASSVSGTGNTGDGQTGRSGSVSGTAQSGTDAGTGSASGKESVSGDRRRTDTRGEGSTGQRDTDGLGGASVVSGERVQSGLSDRRGQEQETENQVSYTPRSAATSVGTLVPRAMRDSIQTSLEKIEDQFGNIDDFVAERLNYEPETLRANFSAEQVDALALAIKNAEEGRGFIIGDQTGIGKGRVVAAMIRYALVNDKVPIFVTEKPNLYADMIRDLDDIGMTDELGLDTAKPRILITNSSTAVPYTLLRNVNGEVTETDLTLKAPKSGKAYDTLMQQMMDAESLGEYKVIFTTYSQLQTVKKGQVTQRMKFLKQFGEGNYIIFDESHNAGGSGESQARTKEQRQAAKEGESTVTGRAAFARDLVRNAFGTFFSSATYAKRPDVMSLYSSTNMKLAVNNIGQLSNAIKQGGVPMQQVVANMLTQDGQYIRRERTFAGVSYDTVETKVDKQTAENMAAAMRSILKFSRAKESVIDAIQSELDKEGAIIREMGGEAPTIQGANFGSVMHNLIDQMLLSLKAKESVDHAIERLKAGEKVVLTVANTMGSFLKDYSDEMGLNVGDPMALSFKDLYDRYLEKQRIVTIKDAQGNKTKRRLTDGELGPQLVAQFEAIRKQITEAGFGSAPISPIDYMHNELRKAGYKTDEITGRNVVVNYQSGTPILSSRNANIKQRLNAISGFNNGNVDVLILNQSGSTGLSLHASSKFKDQRKRHMIVIQAEKNIDVHMQMLGRVLRTGQVIPPAYSQMMADIPAEIRPAAVLLKKMASLNANTTASRKSSVTAEGVVDFMNDYGGQVVQEFLRDNPDVVEAIGGNKIIPLAEDSAEATEDDIRKFTGYIPILPIKQQEQIYKDIIDRYNELIERENTLGTNKLEAKAVDLDAETVSTVQITEDKGDASIFAQPANMERVDVKRNVKPYTSAEVAEAVGARLGDKTAGAIANEMIRDVTERTTTFEKERIAELASKETDPVKIESQRGLINLTLGHARTILQSYQIGNSISIKDKNGFILYGVITDIENKGRTQNPSAGSAWKMTIALANGDAKSLTISFGQIGSRYELSRETRVNWYNTETQSAEMMNITDIFDKGSKVRREKRWMVTGNILAGFAKYPGQIIQYTKKDGTTGQGVMMNRQFDFNKEEKNAPVTLKSGDQVMQFVRAIGTGANVGTPDGVLNIYFRNDKFVFIVPSSKREGGTYFLDTGITNRIGDFYKRGSQMVANTYSAEDAAAAIDYIINDREESIVALSNLDKAREMFGVKPKAKGGVELNDIPSDLATNSAFSALPEPERVDALRRLKSLERKAREGKITDAEFRLGFAQVIADMQRKADARAEPKDLVRGPDWVKERLIRAKRQQELPAEVVDFALWLLDKNPALANDLALSLKTGNGGSPSGSYKSIERLVTLFKNKVNSGTAVHEILHHSERMMGRDVQKGIIREWQRALDAALRKANKAEKSALIALIRGGMGDEASFKQAVLAFRQGTLNYDEHYQLTNPSEYWAVNGTRILSQRYGANTWYEKARQFLREMLEYMKRALGFRSDVPVMRALREVIKGNGSMVSSKMLVEQAMKADIQADPNKVPPSEFMDIRDRVQAALFKNPKSLQTFGWYDKTISTQLNKALKDTDYAKVFGMVNAIQNEVSLTALRPAELAPGYLPRITDVKAAAKTLVMGRTAGTQQAKASKAIFAGTLDGETVMQGKVWSEEELRNNFGLDDVGVGLYNQARAAIDASLDEVAAAEAFAMAQGYIPKAMRRAIIDNPGAAESLIGASIEQQIKKLQRAYDAAKKAGNEGQAASFEETLNGYFAVIKQIEKIFNTARNLKAAGYAPLMRFGKYTVTVQAMDPATGNLIRDEEGNAVTMFFGKFETEGEAQNVLQAMQIQYAGREDVKISAGVASELGYEMYSGISPETLALFAEALGADKVMKKYIEEAMSERSALKRRLERKGVEGYTQDMPRVLANFITSNARHAAKQYYMRDLNNAIKYIPKEKGDVKDEAIALREFVLNAKDPGSVMSSITFAWFLGGSVSAAVVNMTQPLMMTAPYLSQFGVTEATAAMAKALPIALGKKQIDDPALRVALKRASQEGVVDAQEIFHLYNQGAQTASTWLASAVSKIPGAGSKIKAGSESIRARASAFGVLWGSMFAAAEGFNRRLTFVAAWNVAKATGVRNPYAFSVRAVNETQGIFNKANRPNLARGGVGRMAFTFKQYSIMYVELVRRMWKHGGPEGKRAALMMLAVLLLASGEEGLPLTQDLADLIDTIGQWMGYDTNTLRSKRELAHDILGRQMGDFALYGLSSFLPVDFQGRLGLGNLIPGTGALKKSNTAMETVRSIVEIAGPTASIGTQLGEAAEAASEENFAQAGRNLSPKAVRDILLGLDMLDKGYAVDAAGNRKVDTTPADAYIKMLGFNPTVVAEKNRAQMPVRQDINLQTETESSIVKQIARAAVTDDKDLQAKAMRRLDDWNKSHPDSPIKITNKQVREAVKTMAMDSDDRIIKRAPKEMRGRVSDQLDPSEGAE